jgi:translin
MNKIEDEINFDNLLKCLEELDAQREYAYKESRQILIYFPQIFALLHEEKYEKVKDLLKQLETKIKKLKSEINWRWQKYLFPAQIEYVEAYTYLCVLQEARVPSEQEIDVEVDAYLLGLLDCIGELRRAVYDYINQKNYNKANFCFISMKIIFEKIFPLSYFDNVIPGLRHKVDLARKLIEETYVDLTKISVFKV